MKDTVQDILSYFNPFKKGNLAKDFYDFPIEDFERLLKEKDEDFWRQKSEERALTLFHVTAERVPAYKDFLKKQNINHARIASIKEFETLPVLTKKNYIQKYPPPALCLDGDISGSTLVAISSGTSGEPTFWSRGAYQEFEAAVTHELLYRSLFEIDKYKTLLVIGFPMGIYVSGIATLLPSERVAQKGYHLTIAPVGNNKADMLRIVKFLKDEYEQIVLVGHPLFIKDVIETGSAENINWAQRRLRMMFCSEGFSTEWREYVIKAAGIPFSLRNVVSTYGSSELLLMAYGTPLCALARAVAEKNPQFRDQVFGEGSMPFLFQYNPLLRYIESIDNELVFTSASGVPLIRYNVQDRGKTLGFSEIFSPLKNSGADFESSTKEEVHIKTPWQLPFVTLQGRSDDAVVFYAANIYKEHVQQALGYEPFLKHITGKFTMEKGYLKNMDEYLDIHIELRNGVKAEENLAQTIQKYLVYYLQKINLEYRDASSRLGKDLRPRIKLWPYQDQTYFKAGVKPRYIIKS